MKEFNTYKYNNFCNESGIKLVYKAILETPLTEAEQPSEELINAFQFLARRGEGMSNLEILKELQLGRYILTDWLYEVGTARGISMSKVGLLIALEPFKEEALVYCGRRSKVRYPLSMGIGRWIIKLTIARNFKMSNEYIPFIKRVSGCVAITQLPC